MTSELKALLLQGRLSAASYYFAEFIAAQAAQPMDSLLALSAALVSEANQQGNACMTLSRCYDLALPGVDALLASAPLLDLNPTDWAESLLAFDSVGLPGTIAPLIVEEDRLYLYRYWLYETQVACFIRSRLQNLDDLNIALLKQQLNQLYPRLSGDALDAQKFAVALAVKRRFVVISGGPGTGKTTTVTNILRVLLSQYPNMRLALAAPTGKAAARMLESIHQAAAASGAGADIFQGLPLRASTIHRLLGYRRHRFIHTRDNPLALDCVILDEASMIDLTLIYHLLDALPAAARVILLGDRDQLASVAAGSVLADITGQDQTLGYSTTLVEDLSDLIGQSLPAGSATATPMSDSVALLSHSYRFSSDSAIGLLASLVNRGCDEAMITHLKQPDDHLCWYQYGEKGADEALYEEILSCYRAVVCSSDLAQAFAAFECHRVLSAVHSGAFGLQVMNQRILEMMQARGWVGQYRDFPGKPILITANDSELGLSNGDTGLLWFDEKNNLMAYFRDGDERLRSIAVSSLPEHSLAWVMTVHKSQGSEFDSVTLILPAESQSRALSRELLYTAITRARKQLSIYASAKVLKIACRSPGQRHSGLAQKLRSPETV